MLAIEKLHVRHGRAEVLHGIGLTVGAGEIVGLIGPNGAGKTTALLTVSGVFKPSQGKIFYNGELISGLRPAEIVRRGIVHAPQGRLVFPAMTVLENLQLGAFGRGSYEPADLDRIYALFPILAERRGQAAGSLSGGQQQMLAIGRGLMGAPKLLMLDEPQLGLAPAVIEQVAGAIRQIHAGGCTIILVGQHAPLALALSSRVYVLEAGRMVLDGPADEIAVDDRIRRAYLGVS